LIGRRRVLSSSAADAFAFAQPETLDFSGCRLWQLRNEFDETRVLTRGQMIRDEGSKIGDVVSMLTYGIRKTPFPAFRPQLISLFF
jgi:hypothetical protein